MLINILLWLTRKSYRIHKEAKKLLVAHRKARLLDLIKVKADAWDILATCFGERTQSEELELMDAILRSIVLDKQERVKQQQERMRWLLKQEDSTDTKS